MHQPRDWQARPTTDSTCENAWKQRRSGNRGRQPERSLRWPHRRFATAALINRPIHSRSRGCRAPEARSTLWQTPLRRQRSGRSYLNNRTILPRIKAIVATVGKALRGSSCASWWRWAARRVWWTCCWLGRASRLSNMIWLRSHCVFPMTPVSPIRGDHRTHDGPVCALSIRAGGV